MKVKIVYNFGTSETWDNVSSIIFDDTYITLIQFQHEINIKRQFIDYLEIRF